MVYKIEKKCNFNTVLRIKRHGHAIFTYKYGKYIFKTKLIKYREFSF